MAPPTSYQIRPARPAEAPMLSALALRSKAHWGYTPDQLEVFRGELTLESADLESASVLEVDGIAVGFYTLSPLEARVVELGHLFVDPEHLRRGYGARLLRQALESARSLRYTHLQVQSDPNAEDFYRRFGFVTQRQIPTSIPGRTLPLMELALVPVEDRIVIEAPRFDWPEKFEAETQRIASVLPADPPLRFEHFGSTAVPGIAAKPILDLAILVDPPNQRPAWIAPLESLGYEYWTDNPNPDRMLFIRGRPPRGVGRSHHLHVRTAADLAAELAFRDALRADSELARRYVELKRELAARAGHDREAYTEGKSDFIRDALRARGWDRV